MVLCRLLYWFFALRHHTSTPNAGDLFSSAQQLLAILSSSTARCIVPPCLPPAPGKAGGHEWLCRSSPHCCPSTNHARALGRDRNSSCCCRWLPASPLGLLACKILLGKAIAAPRGEAVPNQRCNAAGGKLGEGEPAFENPPKTRP